MSATDNGLLFVYAECGPDVTEAEFNGKSNMRSAMQFSQTNHRSFVTDWYDNEHAPARMNVPGFSTALRYKTTDSKPPSWLAIYDTTSPDVLQSDAYKALNTNASSNDKSIVSRLTTLSRRVYSRFVTVENPNISASTLPAKYVLVVGIEPATPEKEEELNKWYRDEHLTLLSKVPGFIRARRYKLVSNVELAGKADPNSPAAVFPYVTLYDMETDTYSSTPEFKDALSTPWTVKVLGEVASAEFRLFVIHKNFSK